MLHRRVARFKFVCWVAEHTTTPQRGGDAPGSLVVVSWVLRVAAVFVLLDALSVGTSMSARARLSLRLGVGGRAADRPCGRSGSGRRGSGAARLAGVHASEAAAFAVAAQGMIVLAGAGVLVLTTMAHVARSRLPLRTTRLSV